MRPLLLLLLWSAVATAEDWRYPRGDLGNTGVVKNSGPGKEPKIAWKREEPTGAIGTGAALAEGKLLYGSGEFNVACRWASGGAAVWDVAVKQQVVAWPSIVGEFAYFGGQDTVHYRIKMKDKSEPATVEAKAGIVADPVVEGDYYLAGSLDGFFYAMGAADGRLLWRADTGPVHFGAALSGKRVFVVNDQGVLHCLDLVKGKPLWKFEAGDAPLGAPILGKGEVWLVLSGRLLSVEMSKGARGNEWDASGIATAPALDKGVLHYGTKSGEIVALDLKSGKELSRVAVSPEPVSTPLILASGTIFGACGTSLFAVDPRAKKHLWTFALPDPPRPPIVADKMLYVGAGNVFYCLK